MVMPASGHALRRLIDAAAVRSGAVLNVAVQTNSMPVQKQLVMAGHGWTVLPGVGIADDVAQGTLSAAPLCEPDVRRSIVLATPGVARTPPAVEVVAHALTREVYSAVAKGRWPSAEAQGTDAPAVRRKRVTGPARAREMPLRRNPGGRHGAHRPVIPRSPGCNRMP